MFRLVKKTERKKDGIKEFIYDVVSEPFETSAECWRVLVLLEKNPPLSHVINFGFEVEREEYIPAEALERYGKRPKQEARK